MSKSEAFTLTHEVAAGFSSAEEKAEENFCRETSKDISRRSKASEDEIFRECIGTLIPPEMRPQREVAEVLERE